MNENKIKDIRDRAELVRGATEPGENTAERVGGVLVDTAYALDALNTENAEIKGALDTKASAEDLRALDTKVEETANATPWVSGSGWRAVMTRGCKESIGDDVTMGALGDNSVATGVNATAKGKFSHAEGNTTKAEGENSHAEGYGGVASGSCAHVEGDNTKASGSSSHAEGSNSVAEGAFSHAEGQGSKATGAFSHAEGSGCKATHQGSHAEGMGNVASGDFAHAEGANTTASGNKAHTEGGHTKASGHASHAEGLYNYDDKTFISMVGVGKTNSSGLNAVSVRTGRDRFGMNTDPTDPHHGHSYFLGIGGYKGQAVEDGMKSLQEVVADLPTKEEVSASMAVKADLEDGNVPTVQLGNVAAIVDERIKAKAEESYFSVMFGASGGTVTIDGEATSVEGRKKTTFACRPTSLVVEGKQITWIDVSRLDTSRMTAPPKLDASRQGSIFPFVRITTYDVSGWDTGAMVTMRHMFSDIFYLQTLEMGAFNTSKVTDMAYMFSYCSSLRQMTLLCFDTSKVTDMSYMFSNCSSLERLDLSLWLTPEVVNMRGMFIGCKSLFRLSLSTLIDTSKVTDMSSLFYNCASLASLDLSKFNTSKVTNMNSMFEGCKSLGNVDVSSFDTSKVTDMSYMFSNCSSLMKLDLSKWDTSAVSGFMSRTFFYCTSLTSLTLGEGFGRTKTVKEIDFSYMGKWTNSTVQTLLTLYDRKANGLALLTLKLSPATAAALGEDGKATLEGKGYAVEVVDRGTEKSYLVI